ncbi:MAG TPA: sigma-70 family RNA polymerase sigma factor [Flavisolibacter sp.]|jgi:RNA polymerase sigma factor (sigma-70 family)|nr:sigma-70 family RNA polymerase sigma factor [Flavisolibacter sp.]
MNELLTKSSEEEIIQKILDGELALFEILIRRYNAILYKIARSYNFNHDEAQDLLQETHIAAYQNLKKFESRSSYKTWIAKIMVNKCLYKLSYGSSKYEVSHQIADENYQPMFSSKKQSTEANVLNRELSAILEKSLENIPVHYRTVFVLREVEGLSVAETADMLNLTPVNVKVRLNRAKTLLQKELEKYYSKAQLYDFNLVYCDIVVKNVFDAISKINGL